MIKYSLRENDEQNIWRLQSTRNNAVIHACCALCRNSRSFFPNFITSNGQSDYLDRTNVFFRGRKNFSERPFVCQEKHPGNENRIIRNEAQAINDLHPHTNFRWQARVFNPRLARLREINAAPKEPLTRRDFTT